VLALLGLALFCAVFFREAIFSTAPQCLGRAAGDGRTQFFCWREYGFSRVAAGEFPLWNPYVFLGMPFVANLQSAMFYPLNWLCVALPFAQAINWGIVLGVYLSGVFTYLLARVLGIGWQGAVIAAMTFMFGAPQLLRVYEGHWCHLCAITWVPALFLCAEQLMRTGRWGWALGGAGALGIQLFAGHPQYVFYASIALVAYCAGRLVFVWLEQRSVRAIARRAGGLMVMYATGVILAAVQMLPSLELLAQSSRRERLGYTWIAQYSFPPENLLAMVVPSLFGDGPRIEYWGRFNVWEMSPYVGVVALALAVVALVSVRRRTTWLWAGVGALSLLLALGEHTPLLKAAYLTIPGFDLFRTPARFLCPMALCAAVLAGFGADALWRGTRERLSRGHVVAVWAVAGVALIMAAGLWLMPAQRWAAAFRLAMGAGARVYFDPSHATPAFVARALAAARRSAAVSFGLTFALAAVTSIAAVRARRSRGAGAPSFLSWGLVILVATDMFLFGHKYLDTFNTREWTWNEKVAAWLRPRQPVRVTTPATWGAGPSDPMMYRVASLEGIEPNVPRRFHDVFWLSQDEPLDQQRTAYRLRRDSPLLDLLNLRYVVTRQEPDQGDAAAPVMASGGLAVYERRRALPRAFVVHDFVLCRDRAAQMQALQQIDPARKAVLEEDPAIRPVMPARVEPAPRMISYTPEAVRVRVQLATPGLLVLSDLYYPGWRATVDGVRAPILRADYVLRAVALPAGEHEVTFVYSPLSFRLGAWMSGLAWAALAMYGLAAMMWRRCHSPLTRKT